jgi:DNA transformation protein
MAASDGFIEFLRDQLAALGPIATRRMFGVTGLFCEGVMFGVMAEDALYLRIDDHNRTAFREAEAYPPLSYEKQGRTIDLSFWCVPDRLFDEPDELIDWARAGLAAAHRVAAAGSRPR